MPSGLILVKLGGNPKLRSKSKLGWIRIQEYTSLMKKFFDNSHEVSIAPSTIVFGVSFLLGLYFLYYIREIVLIFLLALICMSALHPSLRWMQRRLHIPKVLGIIILYLLVILLVVASFAFILPPLLSEVPNLIHSLKLPPIPDHIRNFNFTLEEMNQIVAQFQNSFETIYGLLSKTFGWIFAFFTILVMSAYLLLDRENLHKRIVWFSRDQKHLRIAEEFVDSLEVQLGGWVRGQLLLMVSIGVVTFIGLTLLNLPYALPLALAACLLEILPNLGPTVAAVPALMIAYSVGGWGMFGQILALYIFVQQMENHLIVPKVMQKNADVSPLVTILVILTGFKMGGVVGALLSVPIYIVLRTAYSFWVRETET
jgi:predicted PurR-regulated permease PerM